MIWRLLYKAAHYTASRHQKVASPGFGTELPNEFFKWKCHTFQKSVKNACISIWTRARYMCFFFNAHHFSLFSCGKDILDTKLLHWLIGWHPGSTEGVVCDLWSHQVSGRPWAAAWFIKSNGKIWAVVSNGSQTSLQLDCKSSSGLLASCKRLNGLYITSFMVL